ncbi:MBL fold metallo-hydrolase [archaeon]|nr:MBL fold metallo-hydrolase [archaeon]
MLRLVGGISYGNPGQKILLDPSRKTREGLVCVSHAHSDHCRNHETRTIMTPETARISGIKAETVKYGQKIRYGEYEITLLSAGHIAGSAQFDIQNGMSLGYTGDFKTQDCILFKGAEPIHCDELVIEATFGKPEFSFPSREDLYEEMGNWVKLNHSKGRIILLGGYATGKAQELTKFVNEYCSLTPLVHPKIKKVNDACVEMGVNLGEYFEFSSREGREIARDAFVALLPPSMISFTAMDAMRLQYGREVVSASATGWAGVFTRSKAFPLSDHADYGQLLNYVKQAEPKKVYTVHGFKKEFARSLRREGFDARPLEKSKKSDLASFL